MDFSESRDHNTYTRWALHNLTHDKVKVSRTLNYPKQLISKLAANNIPRKPLQKIKSKYTRDLLINILLFNITAAYNNSENKNCENTLRKKALYDVLRV